MMRKNRKNFHISKKTHEKWKLNIFLFSWEEFSASFSGWWSSKKSSSLSRTAIEWKYQTEFFLTSFNFRTHKKRENCHKFSSTSRRKNFPVKNRENSCENILGLSPKNCNSAKIVQCKKVHLWAKKIKFRNFSFFPHPAKRAKNILR